MLYEVITGALNDVPYTPDPVFGVMIPNQCPGVPEAVLFPRGTWKDPAAYDIQAQKLADMFRKNFEQYEMGEGIRIS